MVISPSVALDWPVHRLAPVVGNAIVDSGSVADTDAVVVAPLVANVSRKMGAWMPEAGVAAAPRAPRRYTTMEPAAKPVGAGNGVNDADGV